nr:unnamed protein product [Callosobruchus chinensis]
MLKKFNLWNQYLKMNKYGCFSSLNSFLSETKIHLTDNNRMALNVSNDLI